LENPLKTAFPELVVAQPTFDLLTRAIEMNFLGARPTMVLGMDEGRFTRSEIADDDVARGREFFERIRGFALDATEISSTEATLQLDVADREQLSTVLGKAGVTSALLAQERDMPLASDDLFYRDFVAGKWGLKGVWTQALLRELLRRETIQRADYENALVRLAASGYWFISLRSDDLVGLLQRELAVSPGFGRLLELLRGPDCSLDSAATMVADLIRALYLEGFMSLQGSLVFDAALAALVHGRDPAAALLTLGRALDARLLLLPLAHDDVRERIRVWSRHLGLTA
jgi:hypothetical protein